LLTVGFFAALLQFVAALMRPEAAITFGAFVPLVCFLSVRFFELDPSPTAVVLVPTLASFLGVIAIVLVPARQSSALWAAPLLSCLIGAVVVLIRHMGSPRCELCAHHLLGRITFSCPRCGLDVCDDCWVFERCRCRLCEQNQVPVIRQNDTRWRDRQFGPRVSSGRCQVCLTPAGEVDLRACRNCGRCQCIDCWDALNGKCDRCNWIVDDLPDALRPYMTGSTMPVEPRHSLRSTP
jgi:hypothetical protein